MDVYLAKKGNMQFYIQPDMIEMYSDNGYEIYKLEQVKVTDIQAEIENAEQETFSGEAEGVNAESN